MKPAVEIEQLLQAVFCPCPHQNQILHQRDSFFGCLDIFVRIGGHFAGREYSSLNGADGPVKRFDFSKTAVYVCGSKQLVAGGYINIKGQLSGAGDGQADVPSGFRPLFQRIHTGAFYINIRIFQMLQKSLAENFAAGRLGIRSRHFQTPYGRFIQHVQQNVSRLPHLVQVLCIITDSLQEERMIFVSIQNGEYSCQLFRSRWMDINGAYSKPQHRRDPGGGRVAEEFCCLSESARFDGQKIQAIICAGFQCIVSGHICVGVCKIVFLHLYDSHQDAKTGILVETLVQTPEADEDRRVGQRIVYDALVGELCHKIVVCHKCLVGISGEKIQISVRDSLGVSGSCGVLPVRIDGPG